MHEGSCHCGAVRLTLPATPAVATACNCSLCRRIGGPWVYFEFGTVKIEGHPEATAEYIQGDRTLRTIRCKTCGCVTHWEPLQPTPGARHGVNLGNFEPALIASSFRRCRHLAVHRRAAESSFCRRPEKGAPAVNERDPRRLAHILDAIADVESFVDRRIQGTAS